MALIVGVAALSARTLAAHEPPAAPSLVGSPSALLVILGDVRVQPFQQPVTARLIEGRPSLGIGLNHSPFGAEVVQVFRGSPAARAGVRVGDHLIRVGGCAVECPAEVAEALANHPPDQPVWLGWLRHNRRYKRAIEFLPPVTGPAAGELGDDTAQRLQRLQAEVRSLSREVAALRQTFGRANRRLPPPVGSELGGEPSAE
jgi:hypothetical protein